MREWRFDVTALGVPIGTHDYVLHQDDGTRVLQTTDSEVPLREASLSRIRLAVLGVTVRDALVTYLRFGPEAGFTRLPVARSSARPPASAVIRSNSISRVRARANTRDASQRVSI
jgi:hypothetical protein